MLATLLLAAAGPAPPAVTVVRAERHGIDESVTLVGSLVAREEALVSPQLDGLAIVQILAEEGQSVHRGDVLARLARDVLEAQAAQNRAQAERAAAAAAQARSQIGEAQANQAQTEASLGRARTLVASGTTSRETYDTRLMSAQSAASRLAAARSFEAVAEADVALAQAQGRELAVKLARTDLRAPCDGTISRRTARLGAVVASNGEPLFRIITDGTVELQGEVPEALLAKLHEGQAARVQVPGRPGTLPGRVRLVSPEIDRTSRLGRVRVTVEGGPLPIGGFARGVVRTAHHDGVLVPLSAVIWTEAGPTLQVVRDGIVESRVVTVGLRAAGRIEVASRLAAGEAVVAVSGSFVRDGDRVTPVAATGS